MSCNTSNAQVQADIARQDAAIASAAQKASADRAALLAQQQADQARTQSML